MTRSGRIGVDLHPPRALRYSLKVMTVEEKILDCVRDLPPEDQEKVREFAEGLRARGPRRAPAKSLEGLWAKYDLRITDEDIEEARREMWRKFPRDL